MGLSKNEIKYIRSLKEKKNRNRHNRFVAEGEKLVFDLLKTCSCELLAALPERLESHQKNLTHDRFNLTKIIEASESELKRATSLKTAPSVIAVFETPQHSIDIRELNSGLTLVLDGIQDPGNMGTIVRIADWFGIEHIICSPDSADLFNSKTVQATMGAIARVKVFYMDIVQHLIKQSHLPIYGTFLDGENIYSKELQEKGIIVMGSEGRGISKEVEKLIKERIYIPHYPIEKKSSESLNVAVATAIVCNEFRRRIV